MPLPLLRTGSKGPDVLHLKALLASKGHHESSNDPVFYKETAQIVSVYQATHLGPKGRFLLEEGEEPGVVGEKTWGSLTGAYTQYQAKEVLATPLAPPQKPIRPQVLANPRYLFLAQLATWYKQGVAEKPKGSNSDGGGIVDKCQAWHGMSRTFWCAMALNYAYFSALGKIPPWGKLARVATLWNTARKLGLAVAGSEGVQPGDLGVYLSAPLKKDGSAPDVNGHIFAVTAVGRGRVMGLDGNSDDRLRASDRSLSYLVGYIQAFKGVAPITFNLSGYETGAVSDR